MAYDFRVVREAHAGPPEVDRLRISEEGADRRFLAGTGEVRVRSVPDHAPDSLPITAVAVSETYR